MAHFGLKAWAHRAKGRVTDKKLFYPFVFRFMSVSYPVNPLLVN